MQKRKSKYPPYDQAKAQALDLQLNSRQQYIDWHTKENVKYLPRYPERVYIQEWVSWNEWLGTANVFKGDLVNQKPVRPFWDAVKWAQEFASLHDLDTMADWLAYWKEHEDELPSDITSRPDTRYVEWSQIGWKGWLGTDVRGRLKAAKQSSALLAICSNHNKRAPGNKLALIQADQGEAQLLNILNQHREIVPVRIYKIDLEFKDQLFEMISRYGRNDGDGWFVPRVAELLFELDMNLTIHKMSQPVQPEPPVDPEFVTAMQLMGDAVYRNKVG